MTHDEAIARIEEIGRQLVLQTHLAETGPLHARPQLAVIEALRTERDKLHKLIAYH